MAARAMWKAELGLDELRIPVKLYAAVQDTKVHFRLLHAKDDTPVKQQMVDPSTLEPVPPEKIARAVQVDRGVFVRLTKDELAALEPKPSRAITVERVVDADKLDERWFDRPYYLGPDGDDDAYFARRADARGKGVDRHRALGDARQELRRCALWQRRLLAARHAAQRAASRSRSTRCARPRAARPTRARSSSQSS